MRDAESEPAADLDGVAAAQPQIRVLIVELGDDAVGKPSGTGRSWSNDTSRRPIVSTASPDSGRDTTWAHTCSAGSSAARSGDVRA